jgi:hypothetical protein
MLVTLSGIVTLLKPLHPQNASDPMAVTVPLTPGIDGGIVTAPAALVGYRVIVMLVPLLV